MLVSGIKEQVDVTLSLLDVNFMEEYEKQDRFMDNTKQILISRVGNLLQQSAEEFWDTLDLVQRDLNFIHMITGRLD